MFLKLPRLDATKQLIVLIIIGLAVQLLCRYYGPYFVIWDSFNLIAFVLRLVALSLVAKFVFGWRFKELGLGKPTISKAWLILLGIYAVVVPIVMLLILSNDSYQEYYDFYTNPHISVAARLTRFGLFTLSTFFGWAFLHRGFLLFGLKKILNSSFKIAENHAAAISILWVAAFEVLYHLIKPDLEAFGMLIASPIFSLIAIRTRSVWIPTLCHLYIEALFILYLIFLVR